MNKLDKIIKLIERNKNFLITAHDNLDGDSLGSGLALGLALRKIGKNVKFLLKTPVPERYDFLPGIKELITSNTDLKRYNVLFVLDTAGWDQIEKLEADSFKDYAVVNIDHHIDNTRFGSLDWIDTKAGAVGEQIYNLLRKTGIPITKDIAICLYTAILTDTGCFQFANTTTSTHRIVEDLLKKGVSPSIISEKIYERLSLSRLKLLQKALDTIKQNGQIIWMWITQKMFKSSDAKREDTEGFIDYLKAVDGIKVAIIFKEEPAKNEIRVTFRSKDPKIHINKIAHKFNGGGHPAAAGCTVWGSRSEVEKKVLNSVKTVCNK